ncbi:hypothetical protein DFH09DRAFT_1077682 [Mycena vulgaris]|nr:hypothetical protein DFH09DRAFT_1077682 [Mycena vulgaris]
MAGSAWLLMAWNPLLNWLVPKMELYKEISDSGHYIVWKETLIIQWGLVKYKFMSLLPFQCQPLWHKWGLTGWEITSYRKDWDSLMFPGQNGCLSIVASLTRWERAVQDVGWMVEGLELAIPAPKGRKAGK